MWQEFIELLLPNISVAQFFAHLIYGIIGILFSIGVEIFKGQDKIRQSGGFKFRVLWFKNKIRIVVSTMAVLVGILLGEEMGFLVNNFFIFLAGFATDKFIESMSFDKNRK